MANKRLRKLLAKPLLVELHLRASYGVPVAKLLSDHKLDISRPALAKLIKMYESTLNQSMPDSTRKRVLASIFPEWTEKETGLVVQPEEYSYAGLFPFGEWELNENN
ncbi:MAG: hypothetical protein R3240_00090 [Gammaproteobacteria bacterium]|nr:hypothetical protein [Gammaproteobacteria bacterium]